MYGAPGWVSHGDVHGKKQVLRFAQDDKLREGDAIIPPFEKN
jgi:hypothetical protein